MDRFEAMAMLVKVTEMGSLSAAGRALQVPLATLSRRISDLEARLGAKLLIRSTRKLILTDAGIAYVEAARRILEQVEDAEREAAGEFTTPKGELTITAPTMFGRLYVLPIIAEFLAMFPEINIQLILTDRHVDLLDAHVDMAVRFGVLPDSSMVVTQVGMMRMVTCASPQLLIQHVEPQRPDDLLNIPCIAVDSPLPISLWRFQYLDQQAMFDVPIQPRLRVTTTDAAVKAAILSVGVTRLLHYQVFEAIQTKTLRIVLSAYEPDPIPVHLLHASRGQMPLKMRRFLDFAAPRLKVLLAELSAAG